MPSTPLIVAIAIVILAGFVWLIRREMTSEDDTPLEDRDLIAEAQFCMAYGKLEEARSIVQAGLEHEPDRTDLQLTLLEVCFVWGNEAEYVAAARKYERQLRDVNEWNKVELMGKQIAPDHFV